MFLVALNFTTSDHLSRLSSLVLIDAQSFKGEWEKPFNPEDTTEMNFCSSGGKRVKTLMMYQRGTFLYTKSESLGCTVMKMKYKGDDFTFAIFLPNKADDINGFIEKLKVVDDVVTTLDSLTLTHLEIYVPKFNVSLANRLRHPTMQANVDAIFNPKTAGLQAVASCDAPFLSEMLQRLKLSVDECGTEDTCSASSLYSN
ncbi:antichymotrypsin-2-like [Anticarsia gemmatalis]|uniref:antichymotrypsin-2-like n=1 Tax=Anticarsia gemmatalis TaxID=129554 RepID=UPI003F775F35